MTDTLHPVDEHDAIVDRDPADRDLADGETSRRPARSVHRPFIGVGLATVDLTFSGRRGCLVVHTATDADGRVEAEPGLGERLLEQGVSRLEELERRWDRCLPTSDIGRANASSGMPVSVHPDTICAVVKAIDSWNRTGGRFDITARPTPQDGRGHTISATMVPPAPGCRVGTSAPVMVDPARSTITVPAGSAIDLGGLDKGLAADLVADELMAAGATGVLVNVGGDLTVRGVPDEDTSWCLGVDVPSPGSQHTMLVRLVSGGIATSGTPVRRWLADGVVRHHPTYGIDPLDPAAGDRAGAGTLAATVLAADAATADVFATAAMLLPPLEAVAMLEELGLAGLIVAVDGSVRRTSTLRPFLV